MSEEKKGYKLPVGPQHPMFVEAENLMVTVDGETITDVELNIGYLHRGIEELMQRRNYVQNIFLSERICGICSGIHSVTYCQLIENLLGIDVPDRAKFIRTITLELERVHSHLLFLGIMGYEMGLDTVFQYCWKDREYVMEILESISGNRVNYAMPAIGGARRDVAGSTEFLKRLDYLYKRADYYFKLFTGDRVILARTRGIGILEKGEAEKHGIVGPVARASGIRYDMRKETPYAAYEFPELQKRWGAVVEHAGDVQARILVKALELKEAIEILRYCFRHMPEGPIRVKVPPVVQGSEAVSRTEAPRGELIYYGISNGTDRPERLRIRTPSYTNVIGLRPMLLEQQLADLPVIVGSIDPCFSCCDRITLVEEKTREEKTVDKNYFRRMREKVK